MISSAGGPPYGSQVNARRISWSASRGMRECLSARSLSRSRCLRGSRCAGGCSSSAAVVSARRLLLDLGSGRELRVWVGGSDMGNQLSRECVHSKCAGSVGVDRYSRAASCQRYDRRRRALIGWWGCRARRLRESWRGLMIHPDSRVFGGRGLSLSGRRHKSSTSMWKRSLIWFRLGLTRGFIGTGRGGGRRPDPAVGVRRPPSRAVDTVPGGRAAASQGECFVGEGVVPDFGEHAVCDQMLDRPVQTGAQRIGILAHRNAVRISCGCDEGDPQLAGGFECR